MENIWNCKNVYKVFLRYESCDNWKAFYKMRTNASSTNSKISGLPLPKLTKRKNSWIKEST